MGQFIHSFPKTETFLADDNGMTKNIHKRTEFLTNKKKSKQKFTHTTLYSVVVVFTTKSKQTQEVTVENQQ